MHHPGNTARRLTLLLALSLVLGLLPATAGRLAPTAQAAAPGPRVAASLSVTPTRATPGTSVTLSGKNYTPATPVMTPTVTAVFTDANGIKTTLATTTTDGSGAFTLTVTVPAAAAAGPGTFSASDSAGTSASTPFDVQPASTNVSAAPNSGLPGSTTVVTGSGFAVNQPITITLGQGTATTTLSSGAVTTTNTGTFSTTVRIPGSAPGGAATIKAQDGDGNSASTPYTIVRNGPPTLVTAPTSGVPHTSVTVTGTNFAANDPITLTFTQGTTGTTFAAGTITTTAAGTFTTTVRIPTTAPAGSATFTATDRDSNSASAPFTVIRNGAPTVTITPSTAFPNTAVVVSGTNFAADEPVTLTFGEGPTTTVLVSGTVSTDSAGAFSTTVTIPSWAITGTATITATDAAGNTGAGTVNILFPYNVNNGPTTLYFAEGYTGLLSTNAKASYTETLALLNVNPFTATATITYLIQGASSPVTVTRAISPYATLRESVNADIGPDKIAAAIVGSPSRITAERIMRRVAASNAVLDANSSLGNPNLGKTFYFAEGYTGISFQEYLTVANPGTTPATVTVTFAPEANSAAGAPSETFTVPANGRATRNIRRDTLGISNKSVGMIVTSDQPIMAERVLYFGDGNGSAKYGSTAKAGLQTVANQYLFAYGSAGGNGLAQRPADQSFVTILNPGTSPLSATVVAQFFDASGKSLGTASIAVAPGTRQTINANTAVKNTSGIYATLLTSSSPFVAEKPQYYGGSPNVGTHPGVAPSGAPAGVKSAAFPDLSLVDALGQQEQQTVFLYNPTTAPITVTATYYGATGSKTVSYGVAAGHITTVNVNADAGTLGTGPLGGTFVVSSSGASDSFVATNIANTTDGRSYTGNQGALPAQ